MSVTSSATAPRDWEVPSPNSFWDRLLLIPITRGDGTPMDASSIMEEGIVEICIRRAHICPLGVLWYSMAKSVVLFGNLEDVNRAHCTLPDVMELHNEAITVWEMALTEAHVAAFTTMWHSNPTSGVENCTLLPNKCLQVKRHCAISMLNLETLMTVSSDSSSKISHKRLHSTN